ncbi:ATP-dependent 6-phosphofructokinase 7 [Gracilariopsis chorda]|uniref:ATP-dependent 6-phosphofructokinase 7 n=1 Tax=Gracilariopsis chorda TaxID=448386 RepID=A0A2V3IQU2_9FLOR|nr:ATP-dependent 6-phosphofructokinase 7 [Gracilariopsis chorda]|eukprot:PXF44485.1 ATP-dependent 6-phosphofructokinase 7 [Gracilariopsis chorda]
MISLIDKSFGFDTAVEEAQHSTKCAKIEAKSAVNGTGLYIEETLRRKGHMVIVVAEGVGLELIERETESSEFDESGNKKLSDVGPRLKTHIVSDFRMRGREIHLKLSDPTLEIRSVPANASDNRHCSLLAQSSVHGAMHGFSGFPVGMNNTHFVPMEEICRRGRTKEPYVASRDC